MNLRIGRKLKGKSNRFIAAYMLRLGRRSVRWNVYYHMVPHVRTRQIYARAVHIARYYARFAGKHYPTSLGNIQLFIEFVDNMLDPKIVDLFSYQSAKERKMSND